MEKRFDGRTLRKTGRTQQLATRVTPEFYRRLRITAARDGLKMVEVLERALDRYDRPAEADICSRLRDLWVQASLEQRSRFLTEICDGLGARPDVSQSVG